MNEGFKKVMEIAKSQKGLARLIKKATGKYVSHQAVNQWCAAGKVPLHRVVDVVRAVDFEVVQKELRPDFFVTKQGPTKGNPDGTEANTNEGTLSSASAEGAGRESTATGADTENVSEQAA